MGLKLADLLRWRTEVTLTNPSTNEPILDKETGEPVKVYLRVIGDEDLQEAFKLARVKSADLRRALKDPTSIDYKDKVAPVNDADRAECLDLILSARGQDLYAQAIANVSKPDIIDISEVAIDPDAATLEEQEKTDQQNLLAEVEYQKQIVDYISARRAEFEAQFEQLSDDELRQRALEESVNILAFGEYVKELLAQKLTRAAYTDKTYRQRAFDTVDEWEQFNSDLKNQLISEYTKLELGTDDIKN